MTADLGSELWKHPDDGKTATVRLVTIKYTTRCASKAKCTKYTTILIEGRDPLDSLLPRRSVRFKEGI